MNKPENEAEKLLGATKTVSRAQAVISSILTIATSFALTTGHNNIGSILAGLTMWTAILSLRTFILGITCATAEAAK